MSTTRLVPTEAEFRRYTDVMALLSRHGLPETDLQDWLARYRKPAHVAYRSSHGMQQDDLEKCIRNGRKGSKNPCQCKDCRRTRKQTNRARRKREIMRSLGLTQTKSGTWE